MDNFVMTGEAARILGRSAECVRIYARQGKLTAAATAGGKRLFREQDVQELARTLVSKESQLR